MVPPPAPPLLHNNLDRRTHPEITLETLPHNTLHRWIGRILTWMDSTMHLESLDRSNRCVYLSWRGASSFRLRSIHLIVVIVVVLPDFHALAVGV